MSKLNKYCEQISRILNDYKGFLNQQAKASLLDNHKYSEYLFKQLLNLIYNLELKHTEEKYSTNTSGIDLFSSKGDGYSVQITAQNTSQDKKVTDTIADYKKNWKDKYKSLKILFIQTDVDSLRKIHNSSDNLIEVISFKEILKEIIRQDDSNKAKKILDFLNQELGIELGRDRLLKGFKPFEEKMKGNLIEYLSNIEAFKNGFLFYTSYEEQLIKKLSQIFENNGRKALIEGPPCAGKTSLIFGLNSILDRKLIKSYYINLEEWHHNYEEESLYFRNIDSLLIIDNAHIDRYEIAKRIYQICDENKINVLFIARDNNTQKLLRSSLNNFHFDIKESFTDAFAKDEQTIVRIKGIIENRIAYLRKVKPENTWEIGEIEIVLKNTELNLLKTSILLIYWELSYPDRKLQDVLDRECYLEFYKAHIYKKMDYEVVFKYSSIYKFDCPFKLTNLAEPVQQQIDNGVFIDIRNNFFYRFPHTEYAQLLSDAIKHEKNIEIIYETEQVLNYIVGSKPENIHILIEALLTRKQLKHLDLILSQKTSTDFIFSHYSNRKDIIDLKLILFGLNEIKKELNNETAKVFIQNLIDTLQGYDLVLFEKNSEEVVNKVNEVAQYYNITKRPVFRQNVADNRFKSKPFFDLSELVTKNLQNKPFVTKIASSLKYTEWKTKFEQYSGNYSKKIEGIVNLSKSPITRQLAFDLYELLDTNEIYKNLKNSSIDIFGKAINNLANFYILDGKKKPKELLQLFKHNGKFESQTQHGLSKYAIGLSHINQVDNELIQELYPGEQKIQALFIGASANDLAQRIPLFIKCFPNQTDVFVSIIRNKLLDKCFYEQPNNSLQGFTELAHIIAKLNYPISKDELSTLSNKISGNISSTNTLTELANATYVLKEKITVKEIQELITPERISAELLNEQIKFTDLETILTKNLKEKIAVGIYTKINNDSIRKSCLRPDTSFEQVTKVLMQLSNREYNYDKNKTYSKRILNELFTIDKVDFTNKIKSSNIQDLLTGYYRIYKIDSIVSENNLLELIKTKSKQNHIEVTLSTVSQSFRNIASIGSQMYMQISVDFIINSYDSLIENSKGIDIGQISDGLNELTFEHPKFAEKILKDLMESIKIRVGIEKQRKDFSSRIIPQLLYAAGKNQELINEINKLK
ncbi:MAG TPA: hypothetical protein DCG75_09805 [Bacteroidales bacterium]|nr:hypothetical protein [Bacteroidales bacterium]